MVNQSITKEARIYNGEKTTSSINGVGRTGQLHTREPTWTTFLHHIQKYAQNGYRPKYKT